jgi:hypothetical protein
VLGNLSRDLKSTSCRARKARSTTAARSNTDAAYGVAALTGDPGGEGGLAGDVGDSGIGSTPRKWEGSLVHMPQLDCA